MSDPRFIFETVDFQDGANTINNFVQTYNAVNTSNPFQFKSDYDRMKNLIGSKGQSRNSGYYSGLYVNLYNITVTAPTTPSINGPGNTGWGKLLWSGPLTGPLYINDTYLKAKANQTDYVATQISGYIYSPVATTVRFYGTSDDGVAIYVDGVLTTALALWDYQSPTSFSTLTVNINPGYTPVRILYFEGGGGSQLELTCQIGNGPLQQIPCNCFYNYNQM
jgi:hypothetical protein